MKKIFTILFLIAALEGKAQTALDSLAPLTYTEVVAVDSVPMDELYFRGLKWITSSYRDYNCILSIDDEKRGELVCKGSLKYKSTVFWGSVATSGTVEFELTIDLKDGRYRYEITKFKHIGTEGYSQGAGHYVAISFGQITNQAGCPPMEIRGATDKWKNKVWKDLKEQVNAETAEMILSLKEGMKKQSAAAKKNW